MNNDFNRNEQNNDFNSAEQNNNFIKSGEFEQNDTTFVQIPVIDRNGQTAQTLGIIAIVSSIICCPLVGFILALISLSYVKKSKAAMGMETSEAHAGRICSIITLVISGVRLVLEIITIVIYIVAIMAALAESSMAY
jgi:hypothetical protein